MTVSVPPRVVGTPIERARDDERRRTLIVSDLHVARDGVDVAAGFAGVCEIAIEDALQTRLLILGDLFEVYVGPRQLELGSWLAVASTIRRTVDAGVPVTVLHGNRDFLLDRRFERCTGCRVVRGGLRFRLPDGRAGLAVHGDEFCLNDLAYQRSKRWLRSRAVRWLMRVLPIGLGLRVGGAARRKSRESGAATGVNRSPGAYVLDAAGQPTDEPMRYAPVHEAVAAAFDDGVEFLCFGHIHRPARGGLGDGEYCVLPAFDSTETFLDATEDGVRYRTLKVGQVANPAPRGFPRTTGSAI